MKLVKGLVSLPVHLTILMKKVILLYGLAFALLILFFQWMEYRLFVRDISMELYVGLLAVIFTILGIWMGLRLTNPKVIIKETAPAPFQPDEHLIKTSGISKREYDVLQLMAQGLSNQEIADQLYISLNTVKTHVSNLLSKLDAKRRTQAVQQAQERGLIP